MAVGPAAAAGTTGTTSTTGASGGTAATAAHVLILAAPALLPVGKPGEPGGRQPEANRRTKKAGGLCVLAKDPGGFQRF